MSTNLNGVELKENVINDIVNLLKPHWIKGKRHSLSISLAGFLSKRNVSWLSTEKIVRRLVSDVDDEELDDRIRAVKDTYERKKAGLDVEGYFALSKLLPPKVFRELKDYLIVSPEDEAESLRKCEFCTMNDDELLKMSEPILKLKSPLQGAVDLLSQVIGMVSEEKNAALLLLCLTSRLFNQPIHALVTGPTGQGKSFLVSTVMNAFPPCSKITIVGASAKALLFLSLIHI